jgi:hypothetical protein
MKNFFSKIYCIFKEIGFARAASTLTREGRYEEAKAVMMARESCKKC